MFKKKYVSIFFLLPIICVYRFDLFLYAEPMDERIGEVFLMHFFGGSYKMDELDMTVSVLGLIGIVFLDLLFSDYIAQDIRVNSEYIFSRYSNRLVWYVKKLKGVMAYSVLGIILYMLPYACNAQMTATQRIGSQDIQILLCTFLMLSLFLYCSILVINLFSIRFGNSIGFLITYTILIVSTILTMNLQKIHSGQPIVMLIHRLNPMSNILVSWNFNDIYVKWGIGYYLGLGVLLSLIGWIKLRKIEIGIRMRTDVS